ncbi:MAG TPA: N-acetylmuramoyl-L-alanine amidase [Thermoleophilaceae bacterium]
MKLLASAATLVCVLVLVPPALAAGAADFERGAPDRARATVSAPGPFNLVGLNWRGRATPDVELRVRRSHGWSRWQHVGVHGRGGSDPLWVGRARTVQYRLDRRVPGLRLHFVAVGKRGTRARAAQTSSTPFPYVSREDWGASSCVPREAPSYGSVKAVQVHHTVSLNDYTPEEAPQIVLAICRYHRNSNGWNDIGYNALVDRFGTIYEGRAGGLDQAVIGAHAQGFNSQTAGVANIGDYGSVGASQEALAATATYIRWKLSVHGEALSGPVTLTSAGGSASRYPAGSQATLERVSGHRDTGKTSCPGDALYDQLDEIRAMVGSGGPLTAASARLTAALADQRVDYGEPVPVNGTLAGPDGSPLAGQVVEVQVNSDNLWRTSRRVTTGADGVFATDLKPAKRMYVRVRYPGNADLRGSASPRLLLNLRPVLSFERPPRSGVRGRRVVVAGRVAPRKRVVNLVFQQLIRGRWRKVGTRAARTRRGRFGTSFVPAFRAQYRYYAAVRSDLDTDRGASELRSLRVR